MTVKQLFYRAGTVIKLISVTSTGLWWMLFAIVALIMVAMIIDSLLILIFAVALTYIVLFVVTIYKEYSRLKSLMLHIIQDKNVCWKAHCENCLTKKYFNIKCNKHTNYKIAIDWYVQHHGKGDIVEELL